MTTYKVMRWIWIGFMVGGLLSCGSARQGGEITPSVEETEKLLQYLEENGNLLNSPYLPALINGDDLYHSLHARNIHVIDLRSADQFSAGHIEHSVNVRPAHILDHFEQVIDPASFDFIILVCNDAMTSAVVNSVLLMLGYDNVMSLRFGLSSWDREIAENHWLAALNSHLEDQLETRGSPKASRGPLPAIATGENTGYRILRARAGEVLSGRIQEWVVSPDQLNDQAGSYYLISYWPESLYQDGHIQGAIQYTPKMSLHSSTYLHSLPVDKPVVTSCYTGQHSAYVTGFLRLLGYQAYNQPYGANAYAHDWMRETQTFTRYFTEEHVYDLPLVGGERSQGPDRPAMEQDADDPPVVGGC